MKKLKYAVSSVNRIKLPIDRTLKNAFLAYESSWETLELKSEQNRKIYSELIDIQNVEKPLEKTQIEVKKLEVPENGDEDEEEEETIVKLPENKSWWNNVPKSVTRSPNTLSELAIEVYATNYKRGRIDDRIQCRNSTDFGLYTDIGIPIMDLLELENEPFWKRLVEAKFQNMFQFEEYSRSSDINWKRTGLELKLSEFIENLDVDECSYPKMVSLLETLMTSCYHGSLGFVKYLTNLKVVSLMFEPDKLGYNYERWLFKTSVIDFENLSIGLEKLDFLESFTISRCDLSESKKTFHILNSLQAKQNLKHLELSCCVVSDDIGDQFREFFAVNKSLENLELKYSSLKSKACNGIGEGLMKFKGVLKYLGLAGNLIMEAGFLAIGAGCKNSSQIQNLDVQGCNLGENGGFRIAQFIGFHDALTSINASNIKFSAKGVNKLMESIDKNYNLDSLQCHDCNLTENHLLKIKVILERNKYYKDNPLMRKDEFTEDDELEIDKWLKRVKHPILLKYKRSYVKANDN
ncbi:unnamed protein product [Diamesa tonsa]